MSATCIICNQVHYNETVEHIIPGSLGNEYYVMPKGEVCYQCNNRFARVENKVVSSHVFMDERKKYGLVKNPDLQGNTVLDKDLYFLMVKMGYEGMYRSRKKIWDKFRWDEVRQYLIKRNPYDSLKDRSLPANVQFKSIPGWLDRFRLRNNHLTLEYAEVDERLYIRFQFGKIRTWVRMI
ncbi:MAG: hypothetical protein HKN68_11680 [Saprospiraceae bacterium]|nr:hypothetical protein [Saprospiraceae bacterium]